MKRFLILTLSLFFVFPALSRAEDFLGAPLIPGGKILKKTEHRLAMEVKMSHDQAVAFYKNALKGQKDIKIREWKEETYIEDDGNRAWHSISIPKGEGSNITIAIKKDSWTWIISTLVIRYIGVFVVLMVIFISISISGKIVSGVIKKAEARKKAAESA